MHKAKSSIEEVPYCFWRSSVKFEGHSAKKNRRFWPKLGVSRLKNQRFESNLSKITRPVAAIKSLRFALFFTVQQDRHNKSFYYTPRFNEVERGVYWYHLVRLSVCGQNHVCSVSSTILIGSISYLHILSSNFRRCVVCNARFKIQNFEILANFLNL